MGSEISVKNYVKRQQCPFYGFYFAQIGNFFVDQKGNQCALVKDSYSPCEMEVGRVTPNWDKCRFNSDKVRATIEEIFDSCRVTPKELWPEGKSSWEGIPMREWKDLRMVDSIK